MIRQKLFIIGIALLLFTGFIANSKPFPADDKTDHRPVGNFILLYDGDACQCIRERNLEIRHTINNLIRESILDTDLIRYRQYNYSTSPLLIDSLLKVSNKQLLPVLILRSKDNFLFYECSFELDSLKFINGMAELINMYQVEVKP